ncbi:amino acid synthesis family protein [Roseomonas sp. GCM10028921]
MYSPAARSSHAGSRRRISGRVVPSNVKVAAAGTALDVPLGHKDDVWSFAHVDTVTVCISDAPRPEEIVMVMAIADGERLNNRCGAGPVR